MIATAALGAPVAPELDPGFCESCGGALPRRRAEVLPPAPELLSCPGCGLLSLAVFPAPQQRKAGYQEEYYDAQGERFLGPLEALVRFFRRLRRRDLLGRFREFAAPAAPRRFLDVGCGRGLLVDLFGAAGFAALGTQLSETAARAARARGADVRVGELRELALPAESFGIVVFYHVLEHVEAPLADLREAWRILAPGGLLLAEVPSFDRPGFRLLGLRDLCVDYPHHLYFFTPATLRPLLGAAGFRIAGERYFSLEYSPVTTLQNLLNLLPGRPNRLLDALRRNRASASLRRSPWTWLHLLLAPLLAPFALLLSLAGLLLPVGNTYRIYAVKPEGG